MAKYEINNPEALEFIAKFKSGKLFEPILEKIKKLKWILISIFVFLTFIIFANIGKSLFNKNTLPAYLPPSLESESITTTPKVSSEFDLLREEIYNVGTDLPDPVLPALNTSLNLKEELL